MFQGSFVGKYLQIGKCFTNMAALSMTTVINIYRQRKLLRLCIPFDKVLLIIQY